MQCARPAAFRAFSKGTLILEKSRYSVIALPLSAWRRTASVPTVAVQLAVADGLTQVGACYGVMAREVRDAAGHLEDHRRGGPHGDGGESFQGKCLNTKVSGHFVVMSYQCKR